MRLNTKRQIRLTNQVRPISVCATRSFHSVIVLRAIPYKLPNQAVQTRRTSAKPKTDGVRNSGAKCQTIECPIGSARSAAQFNVVVSGIYARRPKQRYAFCWRFPVLSRNSLHVPHCWFILKLVQQYSFPCAKDTANVAADKPNYEKAAEGPRVGEDPWQLLLIDQRNGSQ